MVLVLVTRGGQFEKPSSIWITDRRGRACTMVLKHTDRHDSRTMRLVCALPGGQPSGAQATRSIGKKCSDPFDMLGTRIETEALISYLQLPALRYPAA